MTDDQKSGIALIAGSLGGILTMAIHPTGSGSLTSDQIAHLATISAVAHTLAIVSFVLIFLGACGLVRRIAAADRLAFTAIVTFGFGCAAILIAATVSGFIVPEIMRHMGRDIPSAAAQWNIVITSIFQFNQAFARIYSIAASFAILLWSSSVLRNGGLSRGIAIYGCIVTPLLIVGVAIGHLRLDVHGMAIIVVGHTIWFVFAGAQMYARPHSGYRERHRATKVDVFDYC